MEKISRNTFCFFRILLRLSKIIREFFVQNKTRNTKRRIFLFFFFYCQKISLNKPFFPSALSFLSLRSPLLRRKSRELIFSLRSIFLSIRQKKTLISLSALPAAACVLRVFCELRVLFWQNQQKRTLSTAEYFSFFVGRKLFFHRNFSLSSAEENSQSTYYI